ncbi:hypothetical protein ACHAWF_014505 [Thalassiosira exigua]
MTSASIIPFPIASRADRSRIPQKGMNKRKIAGTGRWGLLRWRGVILFLAVATAATSLLSSILSTTQLLRRTASSSSPERPVPPPPQLGHGGIENDGLVWITPKPGVARQVGWEDEWMMDWKRRHYSPNQKMGCRMTSDTPYAGGRLCFVPAYIPARLHVPDGEDEQPAIPRVIFVTLKERRIGPGTHASLMSLLHHNPEYEVVLFNDEDVDQFVCLLEREFALLELSKVQAGTMRADVWRLLVVQRYGGVSLESDMSAITKLPIRSDDTAVSGVGDWSHLPGRTRGSLEHQAMAFMPHHPFITEAVKATIRNLNDHAFLQRDDTPEAKAEDLMRLTGPAMYQGVLHDVLRLARCQKKENSYVAALLEPERHCDMKEFRKVFPEGARLLRDVDLDGSLVRKVFRDRKGYDSIDAPLLEAWSPGFCSNNAFEHRAAERERLWKENVNKVRQGAEDEKDLDMELDRPISLQKNVEESHQAEDDDELGAELDRHIKLLKDIEENKQGAEDDDELSAELDQNTEMLNGMGGNQQETEDYDELSNELDRAMELLNNMEKNRQGAEDDAS